MIQDLETANKELQSANEEILSSNEEIPIVIVSAELRIRRFAPAAERTLNLIAADVGRPIAHIKPNIGYPDLELVMHEVIDSGAIREREVADHEGRTYLATIRPYRNVANRVDGAVLVCTDDLAESRLRGEFVRRVPLTPIAKPRSTEDSFSRRPVFVRFDGSCTRSEAHRAPDSPARVDPPEHSSRNRTACPLECRLVSQ